MFPAGWVASASFSATTKGPAESVVVVIPPLGSVWGVVSGALSDGVETWGERSRLLLHLNVVVLLIVGAAQLGSILLTLLLLSPMSFRLH